MVQGVYVANVTPFRGSSIDNEAYLAHVRWLEEKGVTGVIPFGSNGEGPSVGLREKIQTIEALFSHKLKCQVIPTLMQGNLPETLELVRTLNDLPITALLVLPPYYFKPAADDGLRRFFEPVIEASRHPVILYHIPKYAVPLRPELVLSLPVWGVKDSSGEAGYAEALLDGGKGVLIGTEDDLYARLKLGASGMISALANFVPELIVEMSELVAQGEDEQARALSQHLQKLRAMTKEYTASSLLKKLATARHQVSLGGVRPPLTPAPDDYDVTPILTFAAER